MTKLIEMDRVENGEELLGELVCHAQERYLNCTVRLESMRSEFVEKVNRRKSRVESRSIRFCFFTSFSTWSSYIWTEIDRYALASLMAFVCVKTTRVSTSFAKQGKDDSRALSS